MQTVIDPPILSPRAVTDRAEIDRLRWFQTTRYFESGLIHELPTRLEPDDLVDSSHYFGLYDNDEICGTLRIIRFPADLPMLEHHQLYPEVEQQLCADLSSVAEVSRLAVGRNTESCALALLIRELLRFGLRNEDATLLTASVERPLVRVLQRLLGVPVRVIGPSIDGYGPYAGTTVPILIHIADWVECLRTQDSRYRSFFLEDLVIDLTNSAQAYSLAS